MIEQLVIESMKVEISKLAENADLKAKLKSGGVGVLNATPIFATAGGIVPIITGIMEKAPVKKILKSSAKGLVAMGIAGALIGGGRGFFYPKGRRSWELEDGKLKSKRSDIGL